MGRFSFLAVVAVPLAVACGSTGPATGTGTAGAGTTSSGTTSSSGGTGGMVAGGIPAAGSGDAVDNAFDTPTGQTNSTPETATPLGATTQTMGLGVWVDTNNIGGAGNTSNYFVFENSAATQSFSFDVCFAAPITAMTATLWKVENHAQVMPPVGTWQSASGCVTNMSAMAMLEPSTEYLFGLTATGGAGSYSA